MQPLPSRNPSDGLDDRRTERIAIRLRKLERNGTLTPEAVVDDAKDPSSPLHAEFEWDDAKAAVEHRMQRARAIIRSVRVVFVEETRRLPAIAYVRDPRREPHEQGYVATRELKDDRVLAQHALAAEVSRAQAALARARDVASALGLSDEVEDSIRSLDALHSLVEREHKIEKK